MTLLKPIFSYVKFFETHGDDARRDNVNRTGRQFCAAAAPRAYMAWPHFSDLATFARVADCTTCD